MQWWRLPQKQPCKMRHDTGCIGNLVSIRVYMGQNVLTALRWWAGHV
jgi:hypothetical protein